MARDLQKASHKDFIPAFNVESTFYQLHHQGEDGELPWPQDPMAFDMKTTSNPGTNTPFSGAEMQKQADHEGFVPAHHVELPEEGKGFQLSSS